MHHELSNGVLDVFKLQGGRERRRVKQTGSKPVCYPFWYRLLPKDNTPMIHVDTCIIGAKCIISYYRVSSLIHVLAMY